LLRKSIIHVETGDVIFEAPNRESKKSDDEDDDQKREQLAPNTQAPPAPEDMKSKKTIAITYEKYKTVGDMITLYLQQRPDGEKQKDIITRYIGDVEKSLSSEEELKFERNLVKYIINRMITKDGVLVVIEESTNGNEHERVLAVSANYDVLNQP